MDFKKLQNRIHTPGNMVLVLAKDIAKERNGLVI
jgi:hypothetical protein